MTRDQFNGYCAALPAATNVVQWGGASVWKVGGKIFAVCSRWGKAGGDRMGDMISFKCSGIAYDLLKEQPGIAPAPYLARAKWVQVQSPDALSDDDLKAYIAEAHRIITAKLTRAKRRDLGLSL
jgi:predicted DNA-binding protein (MmcQ/YjbR family)